MEIDPDLIQQTKGFLDPEEGRRLYELAKAASGHGPCLEIGSYCGKSSLYLGTGCRESNGILFSIDHHRGSEEQQPGEGYFDPETWATPLSLVFIDGGHSHEAAFADYSAWATHVMPGGFLVIHDIFPNPEDGGQAPYQIYQLALASGLFAELTMSKTLGVLRRFSGNTAPNFFPSGD